MKTRLLACALALVPFLAQDEAPKQPTGPVVGAPAPSLRLNNQVGQAVSVGGKSPTWSVLFFYPKAGTPG
jgi:hypothetical protein